MAGPLTFTLLCGLLAVTLAETTLRPPAVLSLGREVIKESKSPLPKPHCHKARGQVEWPSEGGRESPITGGVQGTAVIPDPG